MQAEGMPMPGWFDIVSQSHSYSSDAMRCEDRSFVISRQVSSCII